MKSDWLGFSTLTSDDEALRVAATKLDVDVEELELERDGGCVKVRIRKGDDDDTMATESDDSDIGAVCGSVTHTDSTQSQS